VRGGHPEIKGRGPNNLVIPGEPEARPGTQAF
jgi:hypothetical protein